MSVETAETIRSRIVSAVQLGLGADSRHTIHHPDAFPRAAGSVQHLEFAVALPETEVIEPRRRMSTVGSSTGGAGSLSDTRIQVRWAWRLRVDSVQSDIDAAIASERAVWDQLARMDRSGIGPLIARRVQRQAALADGGAEFQITTLELATHHRYHIGEPA
jgi:hypothetical protein